MAGQIQPRDLLLHFEQFTAGVFREFGDLVVVACRFRCFAAHHAEKVHLAFQVAAHVGLYTL